MTALKGWNQDYAGFVRDLSHRMAEGEYATSEIMRDAALRTGGLPVYCDVGGCLIIVPEGHVVGFDLNEETISQVTDPSWIRVALVAAAEQHQFLSGLRPAGDRPCPSCGGTGRRTEAQIRCGECGGSGWLDFSASSG